MAVDATGTESGFRCGVTCSNRVLGAGRPWQPFAKQPAMCRHSLRLLMALREVPRVAGHDIVRGGGFGTFKEPVVRFLAANRMEMARAWVGSTRFATLRMDASAASICRGCSSKRGRRKARFKKGCDKMRRF